MEEKIKVVLASGSPRRKDIFEQVGIEFDVCPSNAEEVISESEPEKVCVSLSKLKALDVAANIKTYMEGHEDISTPADLLIIGADTIVSIDGKILGKPKDEEDAFNMLRMLSGNKNCVYTGVTLVFMSKDGRVGEYSFYEMTEVWFYDIKDADIKAYINTGSPLDKAGSYGIQDMSAKFIKSINGDFYNVVGFPIARLFYELNKLGVKI